MTVSLGATLFEVAFCVYLAATLCYIGSLINQRQSVAKAGTLLLVLGLLIHTASLVIRTVAAQRPPFLNLYEYVLSLTWGVVVVYLALEITTKRRSFGAFAVPLVTLFAFLALRLPSDVNPTWPALKSAWRVPHIMTAVLAYASFAVAFGLGVMYLVRERSDRIPKSFWESRIPPLKVVDATIYRTISFGFLMQTALLITGAIWAQFAWGRYWSWDPKETWALITWIIYAGYLHTRTMMGWRGHRSALLAVTAFVVVLFTLFGVGLLLPGLHSYAK
jgi:cytochrome c-type biogenesis protein CcsB